MQFVETSRLCRHPSHFFFFLFFRLTKLVLMVKLKNVLVCLKCEVSTDKTDADKSLRDRTGSGVHYGLAQLLSQQSECRHP